MADSWPDWALTFRKYLRKFVIETALAVLAAALMSSVAFTLSAVLGHIFSPLSAIALPLIPLVAIKAGRHIICALISVDA